MKPIKTLIVDDEKHARDALSALLELYCPSVQILGNAATVEEAKTLIADLNPEVVFLDISIGQESGFDLLEDLEQVNFQIIFTTGHSEFAIKAFRVNALDYLLKPIEPGQLKVAVEKTRSAEIPGPSKKQLTQLSQTIKEESIQQLAITSKEGITFIEIAEVVYVQGSGNYSTFHLQDGSQQIASKNLGHFDALLIGHNFYRCHQSNLINLAFVKKILTKDNMVEMKSGAQLLVAGKRKEQLLELLSKRYIS